MDIRITSARDARTYAANGGTADAWDVGRSGELAPGIEVLTSWIPTAGYFESLVIARPTDVALRPLAGWHLHSERYETREEAQDGHAVLVNHIRTLVEGAL